MERLTFDGCFCDIAQCVGQPGNTSECPGGYCDQRRTWERLKEYEDTGLEPNEIKKLVSQRNAMAALADSYKAEIPCWIPVSERLPENPDERVLVMLPSKCVVGLQNMDTDRYIGEYGKWVRYGDNVTHWMPLPEPPEVSA